MTDAPLDFLVNGMTARLRAALGQVCPYCEVPMSTRHRHNLPTRDHIMPRALGGPNHAGNIVVSCWRCNHDKRSLTIIQWHEVLVSRRDPRAEIVAAFILDRVTSAVHDNGDDWA